MAALTDEDVKKTANLAKLPLTPNEVRLYKNQLSEVINFISELNQVDTTNVQPSSQTTGLTNVYRKDEIDATNILSSEEALSGTEKTHNGYFVVPQLLVNKDK